MLLMEKRRRERIIIVAHHGIPIQPLRYTDEFMGH